MEITQKKPRGAQDITEGVIWKQILRFFFPILLGTFFQQLYNTADAMIVGKFVGKQALAAVGGSTGTLINLIVGFFVGLASGATVIISQFYGARNGKEVNRTVHTALALSITGGVVLMIVGYIYSPTMLRWMNITDDVIDLATTYIRIYFIGMVPSLIYNIGSGILRAIGDSKRPLYFLIVACMVNIVLDLLFVIGLEMGVAGAGLATILSQAVSAALVIIVLMRSPDSYRLHPKKIRFHGDLMKKVVRIGLPAGLQSTMYSISVVIIQSYINTFGTDVMAGNAAWGRLDGLHWMVVGAFGISITTFVGQNFGAQKYDRMKKGVYQCWAMALGAVAAMSAFFLLLGEPLLGLFANEESVIREGMRILRFIGPCFILYTSIEIFSGAVRGAGDSLIPTLMTLGGVCILRLLWLFLVVPHRLELETVLMSYPMTWLITSSLFILYFFKGGWLKRCQKKAGLPVTEK